MINIKYVTNVRMPTPRAQGYAIMKMCSEFTKAGAVVELFIPRRSSTDSQKNPFDFYKIEKNFKIKKIPSFDLLGKTFKFGKILYWVDILSFLIMSKLVVRPKAGDIIYTRDFMTALVFSRKHFLCLELHDIPTSKILFRWLIKKPKLFFVLNNNLKGDLMKMGVDPSAIHISPSGVDISDFDTGISKEDARIKVGLEGYGRIVLYSGQLYPWKGADILAQAAFLMPQTNFLFLGGIDPELSKFKDKYGKATNIKVLPFQERGMVPLYLKAADVLVLPNSSKEKISVRYTSPLKLFEYMASKRPIVASDLPSIREVVTEKECAFAQANNPKSFSDAIQKIFSDQRFSEEIVANAFSKAQKYSWGKRAENILNCIMK